MITLRKAINEEIGGEIIHELPTQPIIITMSKTQNNNNFLRTLENRYCKKHETFTKHVSGKRCYNEEHGDVRQRFLDEALL